MPRTSTTNVETRPGCGQSTIPAPETPFDTDAPDLVEKRRRRKYAKHRASLPTQALTHINGLALSHNGPSSALGSQYQADAESTRLSAPGRLRRSKPDCVMVEDQRSAMMAQRAGGVANPVVARYDIEPPQHAHRPSSSNAQARSSYSDPALPPNSEHVE